LFVLAVLSEPEERSAPNMHTRDSSSGITTHKYRSTPVPEDEDG
jgi:hypothetical protein